MTREEVKVNENVWGTVLTDFSSLAPTNLCSLKKISSVSGDSPHRWGVALFTGTPDVGLTFVSGYWASGLKEPLEGLLGVLSDRKENTGEIKLLLCQTKKTPLTLIISFKS